MIDETHPIERNIANTLLALSSAKSSAVLDKFLDWCLLGVGAVLGLAVSNLDKLSTFLNVSHVAIGGVLFLTAALFATAAKYLHAVVIGSADGIERASQLAEKAFAENEDLNLDIIFEEHESAVLPPTRLLMKVLGIGFRPNSYTSVGKRLSYAAQYQSYFTMASAVCLAGTVVALVSGLGG